MKTVIITGASTGIGRVTAEHLAVSGWRVFAGVRRIEDGAPLADASPNITPLLLDVTKAEHRAEAAALVTAALGGQTLDGLVNNAGIAEIGPLAHQDMDTFRQHFEVNVFGLLEVTRAFLPALGMNTDLRGAPGRIVNITSVGGRVASPFLGAYTATKHAVESLTDSLRRELPMYGIDAISVGPGSVKTPIWDKAEDQAPESQFSDTVWKAPIAQFSEKMIEGGRAGLPPRIVAETIEKALTARKPKARYAPVPDKFSNFILPLLAPKRLVDRAFWKRFGMNQKNGNT